MGRKKIKCKKNPTKILPAARCVFGHVRAQVTEKREKKSTAGPSAFCFALQNNNITACQFRYEGGKGVEALVVVGVGVAECVCVGGGLFASSCQRCQSPSRQIGGVS